MSLPSCPTLLLAAALAGVLSCMPAWALELPDVGQHGRNAPVQPGHLLPPGQDFQSPTQQQRNPQDAARQAQQMNGGGRVLSVDAASGGWRVKLLKDGNVRIVFVPN